jgi:magnesium and cobalt transporter
MIKSLLARIRPKNKSPKRTIAWWQKKDIINRETATMLNGVLGVANKRVGDLMVPKSHMHTIVAGSPPETYLPMIIETGHSRFPLIDTNQDKTLGIIMAKDILKVTLTGNKDDIDLTELARPAKVIPESKRLNRLLREFRISHKHIAVVVNEYGSISGLITIEDVLEQIVGDIIDEFDVNQTASIDKVAKDEYEMAALTSIEECNQVLGSHFPTDAFETMGGVIMHHFGRMPKRDETIEISGCHIKILSCDHRQIKHIKISIKS